MGVRHDAESERDWARAAVEQTAFLTDSVDSVVSQRMPSRAEVDASTVALAGVAEGGGLNA